MNRTLCSALNNYIEYSNEVVHALTIMHQDFEYLNREFNNYIDNDEYIIEYDKINIVDSYNFFPLLPKELYNKSLRSYSFSQDKDHKPDVLLKKIRGLLAEVDSLRAQLSFYIKREDYQRDTLLSQGYMHLRRVAVLYQDMQTLQDKLYWELNKIYKSYEPNSFDLAYLKCANRLNLLVEGAKEIVKNTRSKSLLSRNTVALAKYKKIITEVRKDSMNQVNSLRPIEGYDSFAPPKYGNLLKKAELLVQTIDGGMKKVSEEPDSVLKEQKLLTTFHNQQVLPLYNRESNALVISYNHFVRFSHTSVLYNIEYPKIFRVNYPKKLQKQEISFSPESIDKLVHALEEKRRLDSLVQVEKLGALEGYAQNNIILLLDISMSMKEENKLPLLKDALKNLLELLRTEDNISIIGYSSTSTLLLPPTSASRKRQILKIIENLEIKEKSNADNGLKMAYEVGKEYFIKNGNNRIILATDGGFKTSKKTKRLIKKGGRQNLFLSIFYFSPKEFTFVKNDLAALAALGKGKYQYIKRDNINQSLLEEARAIKQK